MSERKPLRFSLKLAEIPVILEDPFTNEEREYILREMNGRQRDTYMNSISSKIEINPETGKSSIKSFDGIEASLICRCLFSAVKDEKTGENLPVSEDEVQQFPSRTIKELHTACRDLCGLDEDEANEDKDKETEKN